MKLFSKLIDKSQSSRPQIFKIIQFFFLWSLAEYLISWSAAVIWMGRSGSWDSVLPFFSFAPLASYTPLGFASRLVGYYGLSSIIFTLIYILATKPLHKYLVRYISIIIFITLVSYFGYLKPTSTKIKVEIISSKLNQTLPVNTRDPDLLLLPEYSLDERLLKPVFGDLAVNSDTEILGTSKKAIGALFGNDLIYGNKRRGITNSQIKTRLIPAGEYLPYGVELGLKSLSPNSYVQFVQSRYTVKGEVPIKPIFVSQGVILGATACSSIMQPADYRDLTKKGATILTNSASLGIFRKSSLFAFDHRGLAKFDAIANARPFVQSTLDWPAFALDQNGKQVAEVNPSGSKIVHINTNSAKTPYVIFGDWPVVFGAVLASYHLARHVYSIRSNKKIKNTTTK